VLGAWVAAHGTPRALVLGVTPEIARLAWPEGTDLLAVDRSEAMIRLVWPGFPRPGLGALQSEWLDLDLPAGSRDLVLGDGCFNLLRYPDAHAALLRTVRALLSPRGRFAFRTFVRPEASETPAEVYRAALAGEIAGFHAFKLRLLMAHQRDPRAGVPVREVWRSFAAHVPDPEALSARLGWPAPQIATIASYRESEAVHVFPSLYELRAACAAAGFRELSCTTGPYELGERCPTLVLAPRGGA
jgi:SAM-dependent methyltransferase